MPDLINAIVRLGGSLVVILIIAAFILPQALRILDGATNESLFAGLQAQGLKLERKKAPLEVLVVDHAEKTPTSN